VSDIKWRPTDGPIRSPVKVVFEGVPPGSRLARGLLGAFRGQINQFYMGQAQNNQLGGPPQQATRRQAGPLTMRYQNNQGHEIVSVTVATEALHRVAHEVGQCWGWALVEVHIPLSDLVLQGDIAAVRRSPAANEAGVAFEGWAYDGGEYDDIDEEFTSTDGLEPFVIGFPRYEDEDIVASIVEAESGSVQIATMRVDFTRLPCTPVVVDLYGRLLTSSFGLIGYQRSSSSTGSETSQVAGLQDDSTELPPVSSVWPFGDTRVLGYLVDGTEYNVNDNDHAPHEAYFYDFPGFFNDYRVRAPAPETSFFPPPPGAGFFYADQVTYHGPTGLLESYTGYRLEIDPSFSVPGFTQYLLTTTTHFYSFTALTGIIPAVDTSVEAEVRLAAGFGSPAWVRSYHERTSMDWYQWEMGANYPTRLGTSLAATVELSSNPAEPLVDGHYKLLGTVTIDPKQQSISFSPAV
jgi:hypothetical protein